MLDSWKKGDPLAASHLQQPVDLINQLLQQNGGALPIGLPGPQKFAKPSEGIWESMTGRIVRNGPGSPGVPEEYDARTNQTYWVQIQYCSNEFTETFANGGGEVAKIELQNENNVSLKYLIVLATNWAEWATGTHQLPEGTPVQIYGIRTRGKKADGTKWFFSLQPSMWTVYVGSGISGQGGRYNGATYGQPINSAASGNLSSSDLGSGGVDCIVWNTLETGAATHIIPSGTKLTGDYAGIDNESGKPIIEVQFSGDGTWSPLTAGYFDNLHAGEPAFTSFTNITGIYFGAATSDTDIVGATNWDLSGAVGSDFYAIGRVWTLNIKEDGYNHDLLLEKVTKLLFYNWDEGSGDTPDGAVNLIVQDAGEEDPTNYANKQIARVKAQLTKAVLKDAVLSWNATDKKMVLTKTYTDGSSSTNEIPFDACDTE